MKLLKKWLIGIFTHPINIIQGNWKNLRDKNRNLYETRYKICKFCKEKEDTPIGEVCGICGCPLKTKLRVEEETCELDKF